MEKITRVERGKIVRIRRMMVGIRSEFWERAEIRSEIMERLENGVERLVPICNGDKELAERLFAWIFRSTGLVED
jgi:hypothetical protein